MGAFIIGGVVFVATLLLALLQVYAAGMSDAPGASSGAGSTLIAGSVIAALIIASHWLPHIGW